MRLTQPLLSQSLISRQNSRFRPDQNDDRA